MSRSRGLLSCAFPALFTVLLASGGDHPALGEGKGPGDVVGERGVPALFSWADCDGDGRLDLAGVSDDGTFQLLANAGDGRFEDVTERVGLGEVGATALALWADYDGDGRLDLFVGARAGASRLFRNEGGAFTDMSAASGLAIQGAVRSAEWLDHDGDGRVDLFVVTSERSELYRGLEGGFFEPTPLPLASVASSRIPGGREALVTCQASILDTTNPGSCLQASSTPLIGLLYPLTTNLFVAATGNVGIGTTNPTHRLTVAGSASISNTLTVAGATQISNTLTLAPAGDQALDVSTGSIYKGGVLFLHTKGGPSNIAMGEGALASVSTGFFNTAIGHEALESNDSSGNIALGYRAGRLTTGGNNIAIGNVGVAGESGRIRIGAPGTHARTFLAGVRGVVTGVANAIPVLVDSAGQLGTVSSSRRFKEEIRDMGDATERLLQLRPVVFRYKAEVQSGERPLEYGLIAEEVAEVFPDLVVYDEEGQPFTVKYHLLSAMLLNELGKQTCAVEELRARSEARSREAEGMRSELARLRLRDLEARMAALESHAHDATAPTVEREN